MAIEFKWFTPTAFFYLFFTIAWNAFLAFWYSMAIGGGAPFIFIIFPVIHVAVGIYLSYFTLCQFVNKTNIEIDESYLTIRHSPVPWWRGNVEIPTPRIDQLYVKENKSEGKNGTSYSYALRARLIDDTDREILAVQGVENAQMLQIEEQLERFIGIADRPVKGEYAKNRSTKAMAKPRRQRRNFTDSPFGPYYFLDKGALFNLNEETLKVLSVTQYDWNDGNSDKLLQLSAEKGKEKLLYFEQNKAVLSVCQEEILPLADTTKIHFQKENPPPSINLNGISFQLHHYKTGTAFTLGTAQGVELETWTYWSEDKQSTLRITNNKGVIQYHRGTPLQLSDFEEDTLDLVPPPEKDIEYDRPSWREEDLV